MFQDIHSRLLRAPNGFHGGTLTNECGSGGIDCDAEAEKYQDLGQETPERVHESHTQAEGFTGAFFRVEILLDEETHEIVFSPPPEEFLVCFFSLCRLKKK